MLGVIYFLIWPIGLVIYYLADPALKNNDIPKIAYRVHHSISGKLEEWANQRVLSKVSESLSLNNISGTEWPMFSAVYYLWATEALEQN